MIESFFLRAYGVALSEPPAKRHIDPFMLAIHNTARIVGLASLAVAISIALMIRPLGELVFVGFRPFWIALAAFLAAYKFTLKSYGRYREDVAEASKFSTTRDRRIFDLCYFGVTVLSVGLIVGAALLRS